MGSISKAVVTTYFDIMKSKVGYYQIDLHANLFDINIICGYFFF